MLNIEDISQRNRLKENIIESLEIKIQALELKHEALIQLKEILTTLTNQEIPLRVPEAKKSFKGKALTAIETTAKKMLEAQFRDLFSKERYSRPTYEAVTSLMLCLSNHKTADAKLIRQYVNASGVTVSRYTRLLRDQGLLSFEGSRRKGSYSLTAAGEKFLSQAKAAH